MKTIIITKEEGEGRGYRATIKDESKVTVPGNTPEIALANLILFHQKDFEIKIVYE